MEASSAGSALRLTRLPVSIWKTLLAYLGVSELTNLLGTHDKSLLACLCSPGGIDSVSILPTDYDIDISTLEWLFHQFPSVEKLHFRFAGPGPFLPTSIDPPPPILRLLRNLLPRLNLKSLSMDGYINTRFEDELITVADLCPALKTLKLPIELHLPAHQSCQEFISRLPTTLTKYTGVGPFDYSSLTLPTSLTDLDLLATCMEADMTAVSALSSLPHLARLRLRRYQYVGATVTSSIPNPSFNFPNLKELHLKEFEVPFLNAPQLLTFFYMDHQAEGPKFQTLPPSLTQLTVSTPTLRAANLQHMPPNLRVLRLMGLVKFVGKLDKSFKLPQSLEELVAPPKLFDCTRLPPHLLRLNFKNVYHHARDLNGPFFDVEAHAHVELDTLPKPPTIDVRTPLPQRLVHLITYTPLSSFERLPPSLETLSMLISDRFSIDDLEHVISQCPSLRSIRLFQRALTLPIPKDGTTHFELFTYPQQLITERFPSLPPGALHVKWQVPRQGFLLPSTLRTLIIHSPLRSATETVLVNLGVAVDSSMLPPSHLVNLLHDNLHRLPSLTHLDIQDQHNESIVPFLSSMPNLTVLKDMSHGTTLPLVLLPRTLKTLEIKLNASTIAAPMPVGQSDSSRLYSSSKDVSTTPSCAYELLLSDLPDSITSVNFGDVYKFSVDSIDLWPKTLRSLSFACDATWRDVDVLELKRKLQSLDHLRLFGTIVVTKMPPLNLNSDLTADVLGTKIQEYYMDQGVIIGHLSMEMSLVDVPDKVVLLDFSTPCSSLVLTSSASPMMLPDGLTSLRIRTDWRVSFGLVPLEQTQLLNMPSRLTELMISSEPTDNIEHVISSLPRTLKYLSITTVRDGDTNFTPYLLPPVLLATLPRDLVTLYWPLITWLPSDLENLPSAIQQLGFGGGLLWTDVELVALSSRLKNVHEASPVDVFTNPQIHHHLLKGFHRMGFDWLPYPLASPPPTLFVHCINATFTGRFMKEECFISLHTITETTRTALLAQGVQVLQWLPIIPSLEINHHPEKVYQLRFDFLPYVGMPCFESILNFPDLSTMTALTQLTIGVRNIEYSTIFKVLPASLIELKIHSPSDFEWSRTEWKHLPRKLKHFWFLPSIHGGIPQSHPNNESLCEVVGLPSTMEYLHAPSLLIAPTSVAKLPKSLLNLTIANFNTEAFQEEWLTRSKPAAKASGRRVRN